MFERVLLSWGLLRAHLDSSRCTAPLSLVHYHCLFHPHPLNNTPTHLISRSVLFPYLTSRFFEVFFFPSNSLFLFPNTVCVCQAVPWVKLSKRSLESSFNSVPVLLLLLPTLLLTFFNGWGHVVFVTRCIVLFLFWATVGHTELSLCCRLQLNIS